MTRTTVPPGFNPIRHDRLLQERIHDTYKSRAKLPEPTVCPQCNALFQEGRWCWGDIPPDANKEICPACHRINDDFPAGFVTLHGPFFQANRDEITRLARHTEERARHDRPLQRIMAEADDDGGLLITTTDIHLARAVGEAVHRAYQGELEFHYNPEQSLLRVTWER